MRFRHGDSRSAVISTHLQQDSSESRKTGGAAPASGYASPLYADSLSEFGSPLALPGCGGTLLTRSIASGPEHDAMGCYPIFACRNWPRLAGDLADLEGKLVSVTLVSDPYGAYSEETLRTCFPDLCVKYKEHYAVNLDQVSLETIGSHHRRNVRRGLRDLAVEFCEEPRRYLDDWSRLYGDLIERHKISGIAAFSEHAFDVQTRVPGLIMQRAVSDGETVGMVLWYVSGPVAYYHLGAYSERGYALRASYALFWAALERFRGEVETVALGAAAGARPGEGGGLDRFKAGWATGTQPAYLCGRILSPGHYTALTAELADGATSYFPAYRAGEFR